MPAVSVIIPLLNKGPHIKRALQSVLNQTIEDLEIIVVEGGSTDNGPEVVRSFGDSRIKIIPQSKKRPGVSAARNIGADEARSDFIAFLDADDEWMPTHLETLLRLKRNISEAGLYCAAYKICEKNGKIRDVRIGGVPPPPWEGVIPNFFRTVALAENPSWTSAVGIRKEVFQESGGFPEDVWYGEDTYLWGLIALKYPIAFSWDIGAIYYQTSVNRLSDKVPPLDQEPIVKELIKRIEHDEIPRSIREDINEYIVRKEIFRAGNCISFGERKRALSIASKCRTKINRRRLLLLKLYCHVPQGLYLAARTLKQNLDHNRLKFKEKWKGIHAKSEG